MQRIAALPVSAYQYTKFQLPSSISFRDMEGGPKIKSYWSLQTPPSEQIYIWSPSTCKCLPACIRNLNYLVRLISEIRRGSQNKSGAGWWSPHTSFKSATYYLFVFSHCDCEYTNVHRQLLCMFKPVFLTICRPVSLWHAASAVSVWQPVRLSQFTCIFSSAVSFEGGELVSSLVILIINQLLKTKQTFTYS